MNLDIRFKKATFWHYLPPTVMAILVAVIYPQYYIGDPAWVWLFTAVLALGMFVFVSLFTLFSVTSVPQMLPESTKSLQREAEAVYGVELSDHEAGALLWPVRANGSFVQILKGEFTAPQVNLVRYGETERLADDGTFSKYQLVFMLGEWRLLDLASERPIELPRKDASPVTV